MSRRAVFVPYRPKTVLNKGKRADHWFWTRYSAYPYIGCQHGCEFCYCREEKYAPYADIDDFAHVIKVKENAPELLRNALSRAPIDVVFTGDYQPAEKKFGVSRKMLSVCLELGFPVFVLERSPLVLRDLDLLQAIEQRARAVVAFSIIYTPDSRHAAGLRALEGLAPPPARRFTAMRQIAQAGLLTGTCFMPILPDLCDDDDNLEAVVRWTAEHGGKFVLPGGLTLSDQQRQYFLEVLAGRFPDLLASYQSWYPPGSYSPSGWSWLHLANRVRELCAQYGIADRVPRPIIPGEKRALNKRIVERLADRLYALELQGTASREVWAYRKAAWAVEDLEQDISLVYRQMGRKGLESLPGVGASMGSAVESLLLEFSPQPAPLN
jgi:DNA repair photolyase